MTRVTTTPENVSRKPFKIPRSVLVIVYTAARETLLIERADFSGFWQSVTGSQEEGESFAQTAVRELHEETGFNAAEFGGVTDFHYENVYCIYQRWRHRYPPGTTHNCERCFAVRVPEKLTPTLALREHVAYEWMPVERAIERAFSWSNVAALRSLASRFALMPGSMR